MTMITAARERMDPRTARSAEALRAAILELAERHPLGDITVDRIVEAAGVSRKTFYNHVGNPTELLTAALTVELDQVRRRMDAGLRCDTVDLGSLSRARLGEIIDHILLRRRIYQQPDGRIHPVLYRMLSDHFHAAISHSIAQSVRQVPEGGGAQGGAAQGGGAQGAVEEQRAVEDIHAGFVAHAYAGAIDTWLPRSEAIDRDALVEIIIGSLPEWMTTRAAARSS